MKRNGSQLAAGLPIAGGAMLDYATPAHEQERL